VADRPFRLRTCRSIQEQVSAFLDDEVDHDDAVDIARHVSGCEACAAELEQVREAREALRALPTLRAPKGLSQPPEPVRPRRSAMAALTLTAAILAGAAAFAAGEGKGGDIVPPVDDFVIDHVNNTGGDPILTPVRVDR
jgi:anti-sigma factor RsiW